ncbi:hypothetical protein QZQ28_26485, partial [Serratia marcescens]
DKAFPEQGAKVSIHSDGSFEDLGCVLANTNLNVLTAVFYWFTLKRDEPFFIAIFPVLVRQPFTLSPLYRYWRQADMRFRKLQPVTNRCGRNSEKLNKSR